MPTAANAKKIFNLFKIVYQIVLNIGQKLCLIILMKP